MGALTLVPPYQLRSGLPYSASPPKSLIVCGDTFPKAHRHGVGSQLNGAKLSRLSDQNG